MKSFIGILILCLTSLSFAQTSKTHGFKLTTPEQCQPVDYRQLFNLEMRNQKSISWCFAHTAADNLQLFEKSQTQISAADIAIRFSKTDFSKVINFFKNSGNKIADQGLIKRAITLIQKEGYCPESVFPSEDWIRVDDQNRTTTVEVKNAAQEIIDLQKRLKKMSSPSEKEITFFYQFNNIDKKTFTDIILNSSSGNIFENIRQTVCKNQRIPIQKKVDTRMYFDKYKIINSLHEALDNANPVSIDFSNKVLKNLDDDDWSLKLHTTAVYGRKYNYETNQCYYLLKDSYGGACDRYDSRIECQNGYIWMPEKNLINAANSSVVFK